MGCSRIALFGKILKVKSGGSTAARLGAPLGGDVIGIEVVTLDVTIGQASADNQARRRRRINWT